MFAVERSANIKNSSPQPQEKAWASSNQNGLPHGCPKGFAKVRWHDNGTGIEGPGKGTIRWVAAPIGEIREELMEYDPHHMHFYQIDPEKSTFKFFLKNHIAVVTVKSNGDLGSIVTWRIYYDYVERPLSTLKKPIFNKEIPKVLDQLLKIHGGTRLEP